MKEILVKAAKTALPIILSGVAAAGITFLQSLAHGVGGCPAPAATPEQVGMLGATFKSLHSLFAYAKDSNLSA